MDALVKTRLADILKMYPEIRDWPKSVFVLGQSHRQWANIKLTVFEFQQT